MSMSRWYDIKAQADTEEHDATVMIYDEIGGWGVSASHFVSELYAKGIKRPKVRINSPGGDIADGMAIASVLSEMDSTCVVDGAAYSIASVILAGCKHRVMARGSHVMIHSPWTVSFGNADELREDAETLDIMARSMRGIYMRATGADEATVDEWMSKDTWFDADMALAAGIVDEIKDTITAKASIKPEILAKFQNVPMSLRGETKKQRSFMGIFSKKTKDLKDFALAALIETGLEESDVKAAAEDGNESFLVERFATEIDKRAKAAVAKATGPLSSRLKVYDCAFTVMNLGVSVDELGEDEKEIEATIKGAFEKRASMELARQTAQAGLQSPIASDPAGQHAPSTKPKIGEGKTKRDLVKAHMEAAAEKIFSKQG
jgi:ATP-dependent protease ClpP protease subunit